MYPAAYYRSLRKLSLRDVLVEARQALKAWRPTPAAAERTRPEDQSLFGIIHTAIVELPESPEPPLLRAMPGISREGSGGPAGDDPNMPLLSRKGTPQRRAGS